MVARRIRIFVFGSIATLLIISFASTLEAELLLTNDFENRDSWPGIRAAVVSKDPDVKVSATIASNGTINQLNSTDRSGALAAVIEPAKAIDWSASVTTGLIPCSNTESNLGKLSLSFDHSISINAPFEVQIESFSNKRIRTGGLKTKVYPAASNFYQRAAIELSQMVPSGEGQFDPKSPLLQMSFSVYSFNGEASSQSISLSIDNIAFSSPAFYVSPEGSDDNDGRSESTAFASPQKALDQAQPSDIILLMEGTYSIDKELAPKLAVAEFIRPGTPTGWITLKNYPGHKATLSSHGQKAIAMIQNKGSPTLAYLEVRGLHIRGNGDTARTQFIDELGQFTPNTDSRGIEVNGRTTPYPGERTENEIVHHIRIADNVVEFCTADGIYAEYCDWLYIERNIIENNCWTTPGYAPAGLSVMGYANFDSLENVHKMLIAGNRVSGNRLYVMNQPWGKPVKTKFFNGNGIILDANAEKPPAVYAGRTLVQNNLVFNNGGGGIQMWANHRMDLVNNTVYHNGTTPELKWGQIGFERCRDVRLINNIIVAQPDRPLDTWMVGRPDKNTADIVRLNNLYWGGVNPHISGAGDIDADPQFVNPGDDPAEADFRLRPDSPAIGAGIRDSLTPLVDVFGQFRPSANEVDLGASGK